MKKNKKFINYISCAECVLVFMLLGGCSMTTSGKYGQIQCSKEGIEKVYGRLIPDYSGMHEEDIMSRVWIKKGFSLKNNKSIRVYPVENFSCCTCPGVENILQKDLQDIFAGFGSGSSAGLDLGVRAAIVEMKSERGVFDRFSSSLDSYPRIEVEIIVFDEKTRTVLLKLRHFKINEKFGTALHAITNDFRLFFGEKM